MKQETTSASACTRTYLLRLLLFCSVCLGLLFAARTQVHAETTYTVINVTADQIAESGTRKAIQAALDTAKSKATSSKPYKVVVEDGTYEMEDTLYIYSNTYLDMAGVTITQVSGDDSNMIKIGDLEDTKTGYYYTNITIYGGTWNENGNGNTLIKLAHASNVTVSNATFKNVTDAHLMEVAGVDGLYIKNCTFSDQVITKTKTDDETEITNEAIQLDILTSDHFNGYVMQDLALKNVEITGCTFTNVPRGIGSHTAVLNNPIDGLTIKNNTFKNLTSCGIQLIAVKNCTISGNTMTNVPRGIYIYSYVWTGTYIGSVLKSEDNAGSATSSAYTTPTSSSIVISNNTITMSGSDAYAEYENAGIWLQGFDESSASFTINGGKIPAGNYYLTGVTVKNNTITTTAYGIRLADVYSTKVTSNTITGPGEDEEGSYGISATNASKKITVTSNTIKNCYRGVYIYEGSSASSIESNTISKTGNSGIWVSSASATNIVSNKVSSAGMNGIFVDDGGSVEYIKSNKITSAGKNGILVQDSDVTYIQSNTISKPGNNGIYVHDGSTSTKVQSNKITSSGKYGIDIEDATVKYVQKNTISSPGSRGIYIYNGATVSYVKSNTITSAGKYGIHVDASTAKYISSNTITSPTLNGIYIYKGSTAKEITSNTIESAGKYGIDVEKSTVTTIEGNTISSPSSVGIYIYNGGKVTDIKSNTITSAGKYGIDVDASKATNITDNVISKSKTNGIYVYKGSTVTLISSNTIKSAGKYGIDVEKSTVTTIKSNTISSPSSIGIYVYNGATVTDIQSNKVSSAGKYGIDVDASTVTNITSNTVSSSKTNGIYIYKGSTVTKIKSNTIKSAGKYGIDVEKSTVKYVQSNKITSPASVGIYVYNSGKVSYIKSNTISSSGKYGISVDKGTATYIQKNKITESSNYSLIVLNSGKVKEISSNTITDGKKRAIFISALKCDLTIKSNTITYCGTDYLIYLNPKTTKYTITVKSNTLTGKSKKPIGVRADSGKVVLQSNTISGCSYAAQFTPDVKGTIYTNTLSGNKSNKYKVGAATVGNLSAPEVTVSKTTTSSIKLKWSKISSGTGYEVYRATSKSGTYKSVKTISDASTKTYTDKDLKKSKTYYYKVRAYRQFTNTIVYGDYSTLVSAKTVSE